jgi:hypothetical protein
MVAESPAVAPVPVTPAGADRQASVGIPVDENAELLVVVAY